MKSLINIILFIIGSNNCEFNVSRIHDIDYFLSLPPQELEDYLDNDGIRASLSSDIIFDLVTYANLDETFNSLLLEVLDERSSSNLSDESSEISQEDIPDFNFLKESRNVPQFNLEFKEGHEIAKLLNSLSATQIKHYIQQYSLDKLIMFASKPGMIENLDPQKVKILSAQSDILTKIDSEVLLKALEKRPTLLRHVPAHILDNFGKQKNIIKGLDMGQLISIVDDVEIRNKFVNISQDAILNILNSKPMIVVHIIRVNGTNPLKTKVNDLLQNEKFLRRVLPHVHLQLAEDEIFMQFISSYPNALLNVLRVFPKLPTQLSDATLHFYSNHLLQNKTFIDSIPCPVFISGATNFTFIDGLSTKILSSLIHNSHMIDCLPEPILGQIIEKTNVGRKINVRDLYTLIRKVSYAPRLRAKNVIWKILCFQVPKLKKYYLGMSW
ncbi:uncharacterized protein [Lepeophtheirus salmonis]|uniref:uncharacterized protein n=1 Tax=Lepeophtheirus salmonis TaxID=72036 RepID=UPI001AE214B3|nr:uncharacterized protein LOC121115828 [Lepeophtheirus salmonis]